MEFVECVDIVGYFPVKLRNIVVVVCCRLVELSVAQLALTFSQVEFLR